MSDYELKFWKKAYIAVLRSGESTVTAEKRANQALEDYQRFVNKT